ncbi:hypothetical protein Tco_1112498 [Tanacetum coccineum]|uniref:Uncharacterized protein n=1 Tax=Tanacetum coccineum TaxID=301880 RepID=A0ABQ5IPJ5_9ASTR
MSTSQDIYVAGFKNRPPMLNKENYVPWSFRLLCYAKSRPNGKLIYNSIINCPYVRRMIPELGDQNCEVHTILLGLPEDIYAAIDSCETAHEIYASPRSAIIKYLHATTTTKQNYNLQPSFNQNYMQQPMPNPKDIIDPTTAMNMTLVLMAKAFKLNYSTPINNNQRISLNPRNRQIAQPGMNMGQDRQMQMVGGNGGNQFRQYARQNVGNQNRNQNGLIIVPGIDNQNVNHNRNGNVVSARADGTGNRNNGNQVRCYNCIGLGYLTRNYTVRPRRRDVFYLQTQLLISQKEEAGIQLQAEEFNLMAAAADLDEIEKVNANCILMANLQQVSTLGTQTDKAPVYDSDGLTEVNNYDNCYNNDIFNMFTQEEQYTELLEPIPEPHQVQQNDSNITLEVSSMEQGGGTADQHPITVVETHAYFESLYNNLAIAVEKFNSVNRKNERNKC